jgi:outer membrane protein TolC
MTSHEPTPEFRSHLEWQIETAMRRESRLAEPVTGSAPTGWLRTAVVVLVALAVGGAAGIASERVQDAQTRNQLIENAKSELALMQMRVEMARGEYQDARRRFEMGAADNDAVARAERQLRAMESALNRLKLNIEETERTSAPPRDELNAPLVSDRDFVRDRLKLELDTAQQELAAAEDGVAKANARFHAGLVPPAALVQADSHLALAKHHMQELRLRLEFRQKYLQEQMNAEELAGHMRRAQLTLEAELTKQQLEAAKRRVADVRRQVEIGIATQLDLKRGEIEILELEVKLKNIQQQLAAMGKKE